MSDNEGGQIVDQVLKRHRKEKKELQAKIQSLKKLSSKGDKKKKKETTDEISRLEADLAAKHQLELKDLGDSACAADAESDALTGGVAGIDLSSEAKENEDEENNRTTESNRKVSKAQKRRDKKEQQERQREEEIREQMKAPVIGPKYIETSKIKELLRLRHLEMVDVASDGDCLFSAVLYQTRHNQQQASKDEVRRLRARTAEALRGSRDRFQPFLVDPESGLQLDDEAFEEYCRVMATTQAWGGQVELGAIADIIGREIVVIQAEGSPISIRGSEPDDDGDGGPKTPAVVITYHRHYLGLGEHYNSTRPLEEAGEDQDQGSSGSEDDQG